MNYQTLLENSAFFSKTMNPIVKLNIGCGPNIFPHHGWTNYDRADLSQYWAFAKSNQFPHLPGPQLKLCHFLQNGGHENFHIHDIRKGFPQHPDNSVDLIYFGQTIEHLNPIYEIPKVLLEFYRMLKPGGVLRITTPDLDLLLDSYKNGKMDTFNKEQPDFYQGMDEASKLALIMYGSAGPNCTFDNYEGHMFLFNKNSMGCFLNKAGFHNFVFYDKPGISCNEIMQEEVVDEGMSHSFITEAIK